MEISSDTRVGPKVALIAGPTASGKSDLAVRLALSMRDAGKDPVIINADSSQVYADLLILSARPTKADMQGIEHRLFGYIDGSEACSAARWAEGAKKQIFAADTEGRPSILVGGTGLYIRTLLEGIAPIPEIAPEIRNAVRELELGEAYRQLQVKDPEAAERLAPTDRNRVMRALEVVLSTGRTISDWQAHKEGGIGNNVALRPVVLLPEREELYERCNQRFARMFDNGAVDEVEHLLKRNLAQDLPVMRAIGVPEITAYLSGEIDKTTAIESAQKATRHYAKRQYTWLRHQLPSEWPRPVSLDYIELESYFEIK